MKFQPFNLSGAPQCVLDASGGGLPIKFRNSTDNEIAELLIFDQIGEDWFGEGVSAADVTEFVHNHKREPINVQINSPGGFVYEGFHIFNELVDHDAEVTVEIKGLAYSAASVIAMAGDKVRMHKTSDWGIHRSAVFVMGNQKEMRAAAEWLNTLDEHAIDVYQERSGQDRNKIVGWIDGESDGTTFSATQCLELGFCDEVIEPKKLAKNRAVGEAVNQRSVMAARNRLKRLEISTR